MADLAFPLSLKQAIDEAIPSRLGAGGASSPAPGLVYIPSWHVRALLPETMLVVGIRGAGKSFWYKILQDDTLRGLLSLRAARTGLKKVAAVKRGFGEEPAPDSYPSKDVLQELLKKFSARDIWRTVVARHVLGSSAWPERCERWRDYIAVVKSDPESLEKKLFLVDLGLAAEDNKLLIVFDALDHTSDDWGTRKKLLKGLMQTLLEFSSYKSFRLKAFVRPDMYDDAEVFAFPDASKVQANKVDLFWPAQELYGLFWQYLGNAPEGGAAFRQGCLILFAQQWTEQNGVWLAPEAMRREEMQRKIFHALTGPWMGSGPKRGAPYSWLPNHLADAYGQASPRSFLTALKTAAMFREKAAPSFPLHHDGLKQGVQEASKIRVNEIEEDYPWISRAMAPLADMVVPMQFPDVEKKWEEKGMFKDPLTSPLPQFYEERAKGMCRELKAIGVFQTMLDKRITIPDVYRIGFQLKLKGGIKALKKQGTEQ